MMKERLVAAIQEAEKTTVGEIMVYVAERSDDYADARWRIAIVFALVIAFAVAILFPGHDAMWILWVQLPAFAVGFGLGSIPALQRWAIAEDTFTEEVHQRALQAFHALGLSQTRDRTGILIFVSLFEHRMEILADTGIHDKLPPDTWTHVVQDSLKEIQKGHLETGLVAAIHRCGKILSEHFPGTHEDLNQLANHVIVEE